MTATSNTASPSLTHRRFLSLAIPNILTNLTVPLAGLLDMAFLGHQDTVLPLAGVALGAIIFNYLYWSFGFLRMGTTGLVANAYGADDREAQAAIFWRAMALAVLIGGLILLFQIPIGHLAFTLLDGDAGVEAAGKDYYHARVWSAIAVMGVYVCNGWLLGRQHPKVVLAISSLLNGLNILLDWWFIVVLDWGAAGAGYATAIAEWVAFIAGLFWIGHIRKRGLPRIPWRQILHWQAFGDMLRLSRDLMLRTFCLITTFAIFTNLSAGFGAIALAGNALLLNFLTCTAYAIDGFAFALESLAGFYARHKAMREKALSMALQWSVASAACFVLLFLLFGEMLAGFMTIHDDVVHHAATYLPYLCALIAIAGTAYIYDGYFIGLARGDILRNSMIISLLIGFVPWVALVHFQPAIELLWWGMISFTALRGLTLWWKNRSLT